MGMPSRMMSGWFWPRIELAPRTTMRADPKGLLEFVTWTPAMLPCSADTRFVVGTAFRSSPVTAWAENGIVRCSRWIPMAVTTTPSRPMASCWSVTAT